MCNHCTSDPRDALGDASRALRGLYQLLADRQVVLAGDAELPKLVELIVDRLEPAVIALQDYVPRGWTPPAA